MDATFRHDFDATFYYPTEHTPFWPESDEGDVSVENHATDLYCQNYYSRYSSYPSQFDDSNPSTGYSMSPSEHSPHDAGDPYHSSFASSQEKFLAAQPLQSFATLPLAPYPHFAFEFTRHPLVSPTDCSARYNDVHHPASRVQYGSPPITSSSNAPRAVPRNLSITIPSAYDSFQRIVPSVAEELPAPSLHLGSPFQYQDPSHYNDNHFFAFSSPPSSQFYPSDPSSLYPSPIATEHLTLYGSADPFIPSVSPYGPPRMPGPPASTRARATSQTYHLPSPPTSPDFEAFFLSNANRTQARPFPSVLETPMPLEEPEAETVGNSESPTRSSPPKTPKKRIRASRAKPKDSIGQVQSKPLRFINFTQKDSRALVSAVAPSGVLRQVRATSNKGKAAGAKSN
ncbi:hypothetical protein P7C70_g5683, partial [Phenoliferia sp. Uapishka_3]